jgi:hypothetical protein
MSEAGYCQRSLVAMALGYTRTPRSEYQKQLLRHTSRCEYLTIEELKFQGIEAVSSGHKPCPICLQIFNEERYGYHVELAIAYNISLVGHIDGMIKKDKDYPLEIKNLGRFSWEKFKNKSFTAFPAYPAQELCYLASCESPGYYVVANRDTGELLKFSVPYNGVYPPSIEGFTELISLPVTFDQIKLHLAKVQVYIQNNELPLGNYPEDSDDCRYCGYKYKCVREGQTDKVIEISEKVDNTVSQEATAELEAAAELWLLSSSSVKSAEDVFKSHMRKYELKELEVSGMKCTVRQQTKTTYDWSQITPTQKTAMSRISNPFDVWNFKAV